MLDARMRGPRSTLFALVLLTDGESRVRGLTTSPHFACAPNNGGLPASASGLQWPCGATAVTMMQSSPRRRRPRRESCCLDHRGECLDYRGMCEAYERAGRLRMACTDSSAELVQLEQVLHPSQDSSSSSSAVIPDDGNQSASTTFSTSAAAATPPPQSDSDLGGEGKEEGLPGESGAAERMNFGAEGVFSGLSSAVGVVPLKRRADGSLLIDGQGLLNLVRGEGSCFSGDWGSEGRYILVRRGHGNHVCVVSYKTFEN